MIAYIKLVIDADKLMFQVAAYHRFLFNFKFCNMKTCISIAIALGI
jgi:hypothetical protein